MIDIMDVMFNELGVINVISGNTARQGSKGKRLVVTFDEDVNLTHVAKLNFTRPDGSHIDNVVMTPDPNDEMIFWFDFNDVWYFALSGEATVTIYLYDSNNNIDAQGQATISVEVTDYHTQTGTITQAQYDSLLTQISAYETALKNYVDNANVVELTSSSDPTISDEDYAILSHKNSKIKYSGEIAGATFDKDFFHKIQDNQGYMIFGRYDVNKQNDNGYVELHRICIEVFSDKTWRVNDWIYERIYNKSQLDTLLENITDSIDELIDGTTTVGKANADGNGRNISETYETKSDAQNKLETAESYTDAEINKIKNGNYIAKKAEQDDEGNHIVSEYIHHSEVVDSLTSTESDVPLSANQGKILKGYIDSINAILQSDDVDLDTIQEIVDFIESNKDLIDYLGENKIDYTDIVDALNSSATNKVLSANQGRVLKGFIDAIVNGTTTVGNATNSVNATYDSSGNKIDEYYFSHEDGFAVGLVDVDEYDEDTGIVTLHYNSTAISDISYNSDTGVITFTY